MKNEKITLILNTRRLDNENSGSIIGFLKSLDNSLYNPSNVEVIFKIDLDDSESLLTLQNIIDKKVYNFEIKFVNTPRVYYKGLHIGYKQAFDKRCTSSKAVFAMADDFTFTRKHWDEDIINKLKKYSNEDIFIITDYIGTEGNNPIAPGWSCKLIEICNGFGPTFSTDYWTSLLSDRLTKKYDDIVLFVSSFTARHTTKLDGPGHIRWRTDRQEMLNFHKSKEFEIILNKDLTKICNYISNI